ncbi:MAG: hypothetical protein AAFX99_08635 [Myxococcota bacterium]
MSWEDVVYWSGVQERWSYLEAQATQDEALIEDKRNVELAERVGRLQAALEIERAVEEFQAGRVPEAQERLKNAASVYQSQRAAAQPPVPVTAVDTGGWAEEDEAESLDVYMEGMADDFDGADPESEKTKILLKSAKQRSRRESGL